ncbi:MAG: porin [Arenicellales bacterium]|nr:porin [Arenicellales bacterium]
MNKKLLAVAVAATLAAPVALADVSTSGSIRVGVEGKSAGWSVFNGGSRLRFKASEDLGNGQTAFTTYEFGVDADKGRIGNEGKETNRITLVGLKGDWGSISLGSQWSATFSAVGTYACIHSKYGCSGYQGKYRIADSVVFATTAGPLWIIADAQMDESTTDNIDNASIGGKMSLGGVSLGAAYREDGANDYTGIGASMSLAGVGIYGYYSSTKTGGDSHGIGAKIAGIKATYEKSTADASEITVEYGIGLGGGTSLKLLANDTDSRTAGSMILRQDF